MSMSGRPPSLVRATSSAILERTASAVRAVARPVQALQRNASNVWRPWATKGDSLKKGKKASTTGMGSQTGGLKADEVSEPEPPQQLLTPKSWQASRWGGDGGSGEGSSADAAGDHSKGRGDLSSAGSSSAQGMSSTRGEAAFELGRSGTVGGMPSGSAGDGRDGIELSVGQFLALREIAIWWRETSRATPRHSRARWRRHCPALTDGVFALVRTSAFEQVFVWLILLNTALMASDFHSLGGLTMSTAHEDFLNYSNLVFVGAFGVEVLLKVVGLGLEEFARDRFNLFDAVVTVGSVAELSIQAVLEAAAETDTDLGVQLSALRTFRMLRTFKLAKSWASLRKLLEAILGSIEQVGYLFCILCLFAFIFTLLGMEVFGGSFYVCDDVCGVPDGAEHANASNSPDCPCDFAEENPPRTNFNTFGNSILAIFQVMTGEDWQFIMYAGMRGLKTQSAAVMLFFIALFVVGNYILLNLFVAILISSLDTTNPRHGREARHHAAKKLLLLVTTKVQPIKRRVSVGAKRFSDAGRICAQRARRSIGGLSQASPLQRRRTNGGGSLGSGCSRALSPSNSCGNVLANSFAADSGIPAEGGEGSNSGSTRAPPPPLSPGPGPGGSGEKGIFGARPIRFIANPSSEKLPSVGSMSNDDVLLPLPRRSTSARRGSGDDATDATPLADATGEPSSFSGSDTAPPPAAASCATSQRSDEDGDAQSTRSSTPPSRGRAESRPRHGSTEIMTDFVPRKASITITPGGGGGSAEALAASITPGGSAEALAASITPGGCGSAEALAASQGKSSLTHLGLGISAAEDLAAVAAAAAPSTDEPAAGGAAAPVAPVAADAANSSPKPFGMQRSWCQQQLSAADASDASASSEDAGSARPRPSQTTSAGSSVTGGPITTGSEDGGGSANNSSSSRPKGPLRSPSVESLHAAIELSRLDRQIEARRSRTGRSSFGSRRPSSASTLAVESDEGEGPEGSEEVENTVGELAPRKSMTDRMSSLTREESFTTGIWRRASAAGVAVERSSVASRERSSSALSLTRDRPPSICGGVDGASSGSVVGLARIDSADDNDAVAATSGDGTAAGGAAGGVRGGEASGSGDGSGEGGGGGGSSSPKKDSCDLCSAAAAATTAQEGTRGAPAAPASAEQPARRESFRCEGDGQGGRSCSVSASCATNLHAVIELSRLSSEIKQMREQRRRTSEEKERAAQRPTGSSLQRMQQNRRVSSACARSSAANKMLQGAAAQQRRSSQKSSLGQKSSSSLMGSSSSAAPSRRNSRSTSEQHDAPFGGGGSRSNSTSIDVMRHASHSLIAANRFTSSMSQDRGRAASAALATTSSGGVRGWSSSYSSCAENSGSVGSAGGGGGGGGEARGGFASAASHGYASRADHGVSLAEASDECGFGPLGGLSRPPALSLPGDASASRAAGAVLSAQVAAANQRLAAARATAHVTSGAHLEELTGGGTLGSLGGGGGGGAQPAMPPLERPHPLPSMDSGVTCADISEALTDADEGIEVSAGAGCCCEGSPGGCSCASRASSSRLSRSATASLVAYEEGGELPLFGVACGVFGPDSRVRRVLANVVTTNAFEYCMIVLIFASATCLAFDSPCIHYGPGPGCDEAKDDAAAALVKWFDFAFVVAFTVEMVAKVVVFTLRGYSSDLWNLLDGTIVLVSLLSLLDSIDSLDFLRALRVLRALRPLRLLHRFPGMQVVVISLFKAGPAIANVMVVLFLFWLIFGILGMQIFKGTFYRCSPADEHAHLSQLECEALPSELEASWQRYAPGFDNIFEATVTLFEVSTLENWVPIMHAGMDATSVGQPPRRNANPQNALFFVFFILVGSFVVLNLFVGVVIDNFQRISDETLGSAFMDARQRDWVSANQIMLMLKPFKMAEEPPSYLRLAAYLIVKAPAFDALISLAIVGNIVTMTLTFHGESDGHESLLLAFNMSFSALFLMEALLKLFAYFPRQYFSDPWNRFDFLLVLGSIVDLALLAGDVDADIIDPSLLRVVRIVRIARILRTIKSSKRLRTLFHTLYLSLPSLVNVGSLLFLLFFVYAILGMEFFGQVVMQPVESFGLTRHSSFRTWGSAMLLLLRMSSGEAWNTVMHDCAIMPRGENGVLYGGERDPSASNLFVGFGSDADNQTAATSTSTVEEGYGSGPANDTAAAAEALQWCNEDADSCGLYCCGNPPVAIAYFLSFQVFCAFVLLNLVIAVILENFSSTASDSQSILTPEHCQEFQKQWARLDPAGSYFIKSVNFPLLLQRLAPPLGVKGLKLDSAQLLEYMRSLQIPDRAGKMHFQEVLYALCARSGGVELPPSALQDSIERQWAEHSKLKQVAAMETQFDAEDLYAAIKVQAAWRGARLRAKMRAQAEMSATTHHFRQAEVAHALLTSLLASVGLLPAELQRDQSLAEVSLLPVLGAHLNAAAGVAATSPRPSPRPVATPTAPRTASAASSREEPVATAAAVPAADGAGATPRYRC